MAPVQQRRIPIVPKDRFSSLFGALKTQAYYEYSRPTQHTSTPHFDSDSLRSLSWNPTGTFIATGSTDRTVRVWNPEKPYVKYATELKGHTSLVEKVLFNPVKEAELASCSTDGTVRFWDVRSKTCTSKLEIGGDGLTLAWSADGSILLAGRKDEVLVSISTESTPTIISENHQQVQTNGTTFSYSTPPTDLLITHGDGSVKILDYPTLDVLHTLQAHTSACLSLALSPTAKYLAIGGSDALISLWDTTDWACRRTVSNSGSGGVRGLSWSFDGRFICGASEEVASGGGSGTGSGLEVYHAETGEMVYAVPTGNAGIPAVEWHPNRYWLAYSVFESPETGPSRGGLRIVGAAGGPNI